MYRVILIKLRGLLRLHRENISISWKFNYLFWIRIDTKKFLTLQFFVHNVIFLTLSQTFDLCRKCRKLLQFIQYTKKQRKHFLICFFLSTQIFGFNKGSFYYIVCHLYDNLFLLHSNFVAHFTFCQIFKFFSSGLTLMFISVDILCEFEWKEEERVCVCVRVCLCARLCV